MCFGRYEYVRRFVPTFWMDLVEIPGRSVREAATRYTYRVPEQDNLWDYYQIMIRRLRLIVDTPFKMNDMGVNVEDRSQFKILREALVSNRSGDRASDRADFDTTDKFITILMFCKEPRTRKEIYQLIGVTYHFKNFKTYIEPLLINGYLELTIPDKPSSPKQQYRTTRKGLLLLEKL